MATTTKATQTNAKDNKASEAVQTVQKDVRPIQAFFTKFTNDWCMNFAGALAYSILMSIVPIALAAFAILGFILGALGSTQQQSLTTEITKALPSVSANLITQAQNQLAKSAGILFVIAVILALFNGSRLFIQIEGFFSIIYHVRQRTLIKQNLMAFGMLLIFIILIPIMAFAGTLPSLVLSVLPGGGALATVGSILGGLLAAFLLFLAIYIVVPNQHISFRNSLPGSIAAAIALELYLVLFPLYVSHFLGSYATGPVSLIILLVFFYYFAVILLLGAEVNAFFAEKVEATPTDLATMVHIVTSHLPKPRPVKEKQAAASHKPTQAGSARQQGGKDTGKARQDVTKEQLEAITTAATQGGLIKAENAPAHMQADKPTTSDKHEKRQERQATPAVSKPFVIAEALAGTVLAFLLEWFRMRGGRGVRQ